MAVKVSCIVCTYNYGRFLDRCLRSILEQTLPRDSYETIVVDDGSTDETSQVLAQFGDAVRVIRQQRRGLAAASNTGVLNSSGEFFLRVDADDELVPEALHLLSEALDTHPQAAGVYSDRLEVNGAGNEKVVTLAGPVNIYQLIAPGILFRRGRVLEVGMYRPLYWEEHDLMIRLLRRYSIHHVGRPLYRYHLHGGNMTANTEARLAGWRALLEAWGMDELRRWGHFPELEQVHQEMLVPRERRPA